MTLKLARTIAMRWGFSGWFLRRFEVWITKPASRPRTYTMDVYYDAGGKKFTCREAVAFARKLKLPCAGARVELVNLGSGAHTVLREARAMPPEAVFAWPDRKHPGFHMFTHREEEAVRAHVAGADVRRYEPADWPFLEDPPDPL